MTRHSITKPRPWRWRTGAMAVVAALLMASCGEGTAMTHTQARDQLERHLSHLRAALELQDNRMDGEPYESMGACQDDVLGPQRIQQMRTVEDVGEPLRAVALERAAEVFEQEGFEVTYGSGNDEREASVFGKRDGFSLQVQIVPPLRRVNLNGATPCVDVPEDEWDMITTPGPLPPWTGRTNAGDGSAAVQPAMGFS